MLETTLFSRQVDHYRTYFYMASSSHADIPSSCATPAVFDHDLPTPGQQLPDRVFLSIFVDIRDIVLTRGNPASTSLYGLERAPVFTFQSCDTLQQLRVDDVKQKITLDFVCQSFLCFTRRFHHTFIMIISNADDLSDHCEKLPVI